MLGLLVKWNNFAMSDKKMNLSSSYSIVKHSNAKLGVIFTIVQNRPPIKAVCTKIDFISEGKQRAIIFAILDI